jgi:putative sigma-54 modulation protein
MRLELTGRQVRITQTLRQLVDERLAKLDRLLHDSAVSLQVVLYLEKYRHRVEMTLHARGDHFFHGTGSGPAWEIAINQALGKINQQARKLKGKWDGRKRRGVTARRATGPGVRTTRRQAPQPEAAIDGVEERQAVRIIRARRYDVKPMSVDEAALEVGDSNAAFLVFRNAATDTINVLFRRPDGNLGLIEPEA